MLLYRGTTLKKARELVRGMDRAHPLWVTDEPAIARMYARMAAGHVCDLRERRLGGAVVAIDADPRRLFTDTRAYGILNKIRRGIGRKSLPEPSERDWRTSLAQMGSAMLIDRIDRGEARIIERTGWGRVGRFVDPQRRPYSASLQMVQEYDDIARAIRPASRKTGTR